MQYEPKQGGAPSLEKLLLNSVDGKYKLVLASVRWAEEIYKREEFRNKPFAPAVDQALMDLLTGKIKVEEVEKLQVMHVAGTQALYRARAWKIVGGAQTRRAIGEREGMILTLRRLQGL